MSNMYNIYEASCTSGLEDGSAQTLLLSSADTVPTTLSFWTSALPLPEIWETSRAFHSPSGMTLAHAGKQLSGSETLHMIDRIVAAWSAKC